MIWPYRDWPKTNAVKLQNETILLLKVVSLQKSCRRASLSVVLCIHPSSYYTLQVACFFGGQPAKILRDVSNLLDGVLTLYRASYSILPCASPALPLYARFMGKLRLSLRKEVVLLRLHDLFTQGSLFYRRASCGRMPRDSL